MFLKLLIQFLFLNLFVSFDSVKSVDINNRSHNISEISNIIDKEYKYLKEHLKQFENNQSNYTISNRLFGINFEYLGKQFYELISKIVTDLNNITCPIIGFLFDVILFITKAIDQLFPKAIPNLLISICSVIQPHHICKGIVESNFEIISYILDNNPNLNGEYIASVLLQSANCKSSKTDNWYIELPEKPAAAFRTKTKVGKVRESFNIVHITDIHYDPTYKKGNFAACKQFMCCRDDDDDNSENEEDLAGPWGDYRKCDIPRNIIDDAFNQINKRHKYEYVYFTGDIIDHKIWKTSIEENSKIIKTVMKAFSDKFNVPVYPVLGNHETHPLDSFVPKSANSDFPSTEQLFKLVAKEWRTWLPLETIKTIMKGGYYTVSPRKGFRIIGLNSNVCYIFNWWLLYDHHDPYDQLQWLTDTLLRAEKNGESVHILAHVPTDNLCMRIWSENFRRIILRYSDTIKAIFNGHTHLDQLIVYYDDTQENSVSVAYNGGSLTTYTNNNPNYRIFSVNASSFGVLDYEQWTYNVTHANKFKTNPNWYKLYSFKDAYNMEDLDPSSFDKLLHRMAKNSSLMQQYYRFMSRESDAALKEKCDRDCLRNHLCDIATGIVGDKRKCHQLLAN